MGCGPNENSKVGMEKKTSTNICGGKSLLATIIFTYLIPLNTMTMILNYKNNDKWEV